MHARLPCLLALLAATLLAPAAHAHQKRDARKALATARLADGGVALDVMLWLRIAGPRADAFRARFDLDRSGRLEPAEAALAGDALAPEAIGGLLARFDGAARPPKGAEAKARIAEDGALEVAILLTWTPSPAGAIELAVRRDREKPGAPAVIAELAAILPLRVLGATPRTTGAIAGPAPLLPGAPGLTARLGVPHPAPTTPEAAP